METVGKTFAGARTPVGTTVEFHARGRRIEAKVAELHRKNAILAAGEAGRWRVPYSAMRIVKPSPGQRRELHQADRLIQDLMVRQKVYHGLADEWSATFDLAAGRAGICYFREKLICLAVSYCMTAPEEELIDTVLHEVAHALVGAEHNHDRVWKLAAMRIGCTADRCTAVTHTASKWIGRCKCARPILRKRLTREIRRTGRCAVCKTKIVWSTNTEAIGTD